MDSNMFDDEMIPMNEALTGDNLNRQDDDDMMMPNMNMQGMPMYNIPSYGNMQYMPMYSNPMYTMPTQNVGMPSTPNHVMPNMYNMPGLYPNQGMYTMPGMYNTPDMGHFYPMCPMMHNMPMHSYEHMHSGMNPYMESQTNKDYDMDYSNLTRSIPEDDMPADNSNLDSDIDARTEPENQNVSDDIEENDVDDSRIYGNIDEIVARIEQYNPGIFRTMASFGIPYAEARRIVRRIVRLTLAYSG